MQLIKLLENYYKSLGSEWSQDSLAKKNAHKRTAQKLHESVNK